MSDRDDWIELDESTFSTMFREFEATKEDKLKIVLEKSLEKLNQTNLTFSKQAVEDVVNTFRVFITAKILQSWNENSMPPTKITIEIEVKNESE